MNIEFKKINNVRVNNIYENFFIIYADLHAKVKYSFFEKLFLMKRDKNVFTRIFAKKTFLNFENLNCYIHVIIDKDFNLLLLQDFLEWYYLDSGEKLDEIPLNKLRLNIISKLDI